MLDVLQKIMDRTRKEILEDISDSLDRPLEVAPIEVNVNGPDLSDVSDALVRSGESVKDAAVLGIAGAALNFSAAMQSRPQTDDEKLLREILGSSIMLGSVEKLIEEEDSITYDKAVERAYVPNSDSEYRRTLLNRLIQVHQVIDVETTEGIDYVTVDYDPEYYDAYVNFIGDLMQKAEDAGFHIMKV